MELENDFIAVNQRPLISIIMATYNRAHTIERAIESVIRQNYANFELIIVDDGSTDNTLEILSTYTDSRIRVLKHEKNKGVTPAKNFGLNAIRGEWFTFLDSDDEMVVPAALETLLSVQSVDQRIDAINCNGMDSVSGKFTGRGINKDQYIDEKYITLNCKGDHWGLTKTSLLGSDRFNEELPGWENTLWYKINARANRFYIHKALLIVHTGGADRLTKVNVSNKSRVKEQQAKIYRALLKEEFFLKKMAQFNYQAFARLCVKGVVVSMAINDSKMGHYYYELLASNRVGRNWGNLIIASLALRAGYWGGVTLYWGMTMRRKLKK